MLEAFLLLTGGKERKRMSMVFFFFLKVQYVGKHVFQLLWVGIRQTSSIQPSRSYWRNGWTWEWG